MSDELETRLRKIEGQLAALEILKAMGDVMGVAVDHRGGDIVGAAKELQASKIELISVSRETLGENADEALACVQRITDLMVAMASPIQKRFETMQSDSANTPTR